MITKFNDTKKTRWRGPRPISKARNTRLAAYSRVVRLWRNEPGNDLCAFPWCKTPADKNPHHKRGRIGALLTDKRYFVPVCWKHHQWIHANPRVARNLKLLAQPGEWNTVPRP